MSSTQSNVNNTKWTTQFQSTTPPGIPIFSWQGSNIVLVFVFSGLIALMIFLGIQRIVGRVNRSVRFLRKQIEPGAGAPKKLRAEINFNLDKVAQFMYEPKLFQTGTASSSEKKEGDYYRKKTIDDFTELDKALYNLNPELKRPMGKDVHQHLLDVKSHSSGCLKSIRTSHLHSLAEIYVHARYEPELFQINEYKKFKELLSEIKLVLEKRSGRKSRKSSHATAFAEKEQEQKNVAVEKNENNSAPISLSDVQTVVSSQSADIKIQLSRDTSPLLSSTED